MPCVDAAGLRMHYRERGSGPETLLLVHGSLCSSRWWLPVMERLPERFRVLAPDLRGCGLTDQPASGYDRGQHVRDLSAFLDALDVASVVWVGHSLGSSIGIHFALEHPGRVPGVLVLGAGAGRGSGWPSEGWFRRAERARADREVLRRFLGAGFAILPDAETFEQYLDDAAGASEGAWFGTARSVSRESVSLIDQLDRLAVPVIFCHGDADRVVPRDWVVQSHRTVPGSRFVAFPGCGHNLHVEAPDRVAALILELAQAAAEPSAARPDARES